MNTISWKTLFFAVVTLLLQGCAASRSNLLCADGCHAGTPTADTQWSIQLNDNLTRHQEHKDLFVHVETGAWEPSQTCGSPGLLRTLTYSLLGGAVSGIAYKTIQNPYAAGAVGGAANGVINQISNSNLSQVCRDAATVAARHNARPEVAREIIRWNVRRNLEATRITQEVMNEETRVSTVPVQPSAQQVSTSFDQHIQILKVCAADAQSKHQDLFAQMTLEQVLDDMDRRCQAKGQDGFGVLPGQNRCGCGGV